MTYALQLSEERQKLYTYITHLVMIAEERGIKMMIENPYSEQSYLIKYWPIKPKLIHKNRRLDGDYYEKPTMYYFINCEPQENIILEPLVFHKKRTIETSHGIDRSIISSDYVERFIKRHILGIIGEYKYE